MARRTSSRSSKNGSSSLGDFVFQVGPAMGVERPFPSETQPDVAQHGRVTGAIPRALGFGKVDAAKVLRDWEARVAQMRELVARSAVSMPGDLGLDSVSFSLAFSVEGGFWVFAKAGAEATVEVTFKRKTS